MADRPTLLLVSQPLGEGVANHVLEIVRGLEGSSFALHVACPRASTLWHDLEPMGGVTRHEIAPARRPTPADLRTLATLLPLVRRADVVHAHSAKGGFLARLAAALARRTQRVAYTPHGWSFWAAAGAERELYLRLERRAARWCRAVVALSEHERSAGLAARIGDAWLYRLIRGGVDLERFAAPPQPVAGRIVMVGRLAPPKRHDVVLRAFLRARARHPGAHLELVGDGPSRSEVERLVADLGAADSVRLLGSRSDVPSLLARAAVLVLASDYEALPLSVLEAMAAGVPVVATRAGGIPEIVEEGVSGHVVGPEDEVGLASAIEGLLADPERARTLGVRGREIVVRRFSRERMIAELVSLYAELADGE